MGDAETVNIASYEDQYVLRMAKVLEILADKPRPVLDIGPGLGLLERLFDSDQMIVLDCEPRFFNAQSYKVKILAVAEALPFKDCSIPSVVCTSTFQVMRDQDMFLRELARVLASKGCFILTIEYGANYEEEIQTYRARDVAKLVARMRDLGLIVNEHKCLCRSTDWTTRYEDGFSLWILGGKEEGEAM